MVYSLGHAPVVAPSLSHPCHILPSVLHPFSLYLLPTRSTSNPSATLRPLPQKPLPQAAHQRTIIYLAPARVETALPATRHNAFPSPLSGRLRRAAVRQIHPSRPCLAITMVSHQVKYEAANVPRLARPHQLPKRDLNPARPHPAAPRHAAPRRAAQLHRSPFPPV